MYGRQGWRTEAHLGRAIDGNELSDRAKTVLRLITVADTDSVEKTSADQFLALFVLLPQTTLTEHSDVESCD